jgi:hypothetical protein
VLVLLKQRSQSVVSEPMSPGHLLEMQIKNKSSSGDSAAGRRLWATDLDSVLNFSALLSYSQVLLFTHKCPPDPHHSLGCGESRV